MNALKSSLRARTRSCAYEQAEAKKVEEVYRDAQRPSAKHGVPYHVEHQVPRKDRRCQGGTSVPMCGLPPQT